MELQQQNVALRNVGPIIQTVIENLTGKSLNRIPSKDVPAQILKEANLIAKSHVVSEMLADAIPEQSGNCFKLKWNNKIP